MVLGAGSGGSNNLIRSFRESFSVKKIIGSNSLRHCVVKSNADKTYLLPESSSKNYKEELVNVILNERIDLVVPNNDREVATISSIRDELPSKVFLPTHNDILTCQNKDIFYRTLQSNGELVPESIRVVSFETIGENMDTIGQFDKYWVRPIKGSGSTGATWVYNKEQAIKWIDLWVELRGYKYTDFQISRFLSGRDFNFQSIWQYGEVIIYSMVERKSYFMGKNKLSGMSSTPEVAVSIRDEKVTQKVLKIIRSVCDKPNGSINVDIKEDSDGNVYATEINIGRFPMITTIHDAICATSPAVAYLLIAFGQDVSHILLGEYKESVAIARDLDTEPYIYNQRDN